MVGHPVLLQSTHHRECDGRRWRVRCGSAESSIATGALSRRLFAWEQWLQTRPAEAVKAEQMIRKGSARARRRTFDLEAVPRETFAPLADRAERKRLTPGARGQRRQPIADPHRLEPPSGGRIGLPNQNDAARLERTDGGRQQRILIVRAASCAARRRAERRGRRPPKWSGRRIRRSPHPLQAPLAQAVRDAAATRCRPCARNAEGACLRLRSCALEAFGLGEQREHQTLAASDVEQSASRRQPSAEQHVSIQRIAAQLSASELPRRNARRRRSGRRPHAPSVSKNGSRAPPPSARYVATPPIAPSTPPTTALPTRRSAPNCHGVIVRTVSSVSARNEPGAKPRAGLEFGEHEQRRDDRIRHVRGQVHFQAVEAEQPADHPAEQKMKPVERRAADEQPHADRARFAYTPLPFGA